MPDLSSCIHMIALVVIVGGLVWLTCIMFNTEFNFKAMIGLVLVGLLFYRLKHPSTTFAADGNDAAWDAAVQQSKTSGEPTVVLFTAKWCGPCQSLHSSVLSRDDVQQELGRHYNFYTVDLTNPSAEVSAHARKLGVSGIPAMIRYDVNLKETDRAHYLEADEMIEWLKAGE